VQNNMLHSFFQLLVHYAYTEINSLRVIPQTLKSRIGRTAWRVQCLTVTELRIARLCVWYDE